MKIEQIAKLVEQVRDLEYKQNTLIEQVRYLEKQSEMLQERTQKLEKWQSAKSEII